MTESTNLYSKIIELIFFKYYQEGSTEIQFDRSEISQTAATLGKEVKNIGDVIYTFRYRKDLPERIANTTSPGLEWIIRPAGIAIYKFVLTAKFVVAPSPLLAETKIPDATPGIINQYALSDEQALLAKLRYNRLVDLFLSLTCYSLQNHLRTTVRNVGQIETDEIYIGLDKRGAHYVIPVQAKGGKDRIGRIQIEQDIAMCAAKFPNLICLPIAAQFMDNNLIALFAFEEGEKDLVIATERHYRSVRPQELTVEELAIYRERRT